MNLFRIQIFNGRKRKNFTKSNDLFYHFKVERMGTYCLQIFVLLEKKQKYREKNFRWNPFKKHITNF